jgi:flagellar hook assembly protein FlgD
LGNNAVQYLADTCLFTYEIATGGFVTLRILDIQGKHVRTLYSGSRSPGRYTVTWKGKNDSGEPVASGVYFYALDSGTKVESKKMVLIR